MNKRILDVAVVTLFNPDNRVFDNILTYLPYIKELLIIDNSSIPFNIDVLKNKYSNITLLSSGKNLGISKSLNLAVKYAKLKKYRWLLTMDQDSYFDSSEIEKFIRLFYKSLDDTLAIFAPLHNKKFLFLEKTYNKDIVFVMTSANIINIEKTISIGMFDEKLFIDEVDHDFCLRLKKEGYNIFQNQNSYINHRLGEKHKKFNINLYPSKRIYYIIRNYLYIRKKHKRDMPFFFKKRDIYLLKFFLQQFIYSKNKIEYSYMLSKGIKDYKNKKMGYQIML